MAPQPAAVSRATARRSPTLVADLAMALQLAAAALLLPTALFAQPNAAQTSQETPSPEQSGNATPRLHQRSEAADDDVRSPANPQVPSTLPSDASGEYKLGKPGDVIEIILDANGLTGYISMIGQAEAGETAAGKSAMNKEVALTYFFDQTELGAKSLSFSTKPVHGQFYSFQGTIIRGPVTTKQKDGYYLLQGTLTLHNMADRSEQPKRVMLPLARSSDS